ncbi:TonB-dependent receptor plug domain-containing protein [Sphingomonas paucimobilis]|uniref:TonB-dependent receptor plug domain-containing protein n=1 Tax=Sphingomonas paucimobilis TaxID=13689 RepID=UPI001E4C5327|nr:TonB-dependent receptor [Sphingomonas paucimobilis]
MKQFFRGQLLATSLLAGTVVFGAAPAFAQTTDQTGNAPVAAPPAAQEPGVQTSESTSPATQTGDVVVTGTLIRNPNIVATSPVTVVSQEEIRLRQVNVAEQILRELPGAVPSIGSQVNNGNGGASFVNLRGLGVNRNLVLLDGARIAPANLGGATDLNNIPLALIERMDVLTGGSSTTYGADAVAGVVNFITRSDFSGVDVAVTDQITGKGDGHSYRAELTVGANMDDGRGNAVLSIGFQDQSPVYQGDRSYGIQSIDSYSGAAGGSGTTVPGRFSVGSTGTRQINQAGTAFVPTYSLFNFNPYNIYQTPFKRFNIFGSTRYEVSDHLEFYSQAMFSKNTVSTIIAPSGTFGNPLTVPISNPYLSGGVRDSFCLNAVDADPTTTGRQAPTQAQCNAYYTATSPTDANYRTFTTAAFRRFVEAGPRISEYTTQLFNIRAGVRGALVGNFNDDVFGTYGESENTQRQSGNGLLSRLQQATLATNTSTCLTATNGCVPINLFGPAGSITADQLGYLLGVTTSSGVMTSLGTLRGVISGDFGVSSPFADTPVSIAFGGEYRKYTARTTSDTATQTPAEVLGNGGATPNASGRYDVKEGFVELVAPLVEDKPFFRSLTLEAGARYSDYSRSGGNWTWKAGGSWEPVAAFKLRGLYTRAVRAPNIGELFSPAVTGLDNLAVDPCAGSAPTANANLRAVCIAQGAPAATIGNIAQPSSGQINTTGGGNPNLGVETASTVTIGAVIQPTFLSGFSMTVDYYNIKVNNAISSPTVGDVVNACFANLTAASATSAACTGIRRNPLTGGLDGSAATTPGLPVPLANIGQLLTDGIDLSASYRHDLGFGKLALAFNGNWTSRSKFKATPTSIYRECTSYYSVNCGSIQPEFSFNQRTTLSIDKVDLSVLWRFLSPAKYEPLALADDIAAGGGPVAAYQRIGAYHYFDLAAQFQATDRFSLLFAVRNVFDRKPPFVGSSIGSTAYNSGNTYPSTYDPLGRLFSVTARVTL